MALNLEKNNNSNLLSSLCMTRLMKTFALVVKVGRDRKWYKRKFQASLDFVPPKPAQAMIRHTKRTPSAENPPGTVEVNVTYKQACFS